MDLDQDASQPVLLRARPDRHPVLGGLLIVLH